MSASEAQDTSTNNGNSKKRKREGEAEAPSKKEKKVTIQEQKEAVLQTKAKGAKEKLERLQNFVTEIHLPVWPDLPYLIQFCGDISGPVPRNTETLNFLKVSLKGVEDEKISEIPHHRQPLYVALRKTAEEALRAVAPLYEELLNMDRSPPSASQYALPPVWAIWQAKSTGILNLRPSGNQGLPLSALHPVFARFRYMLKHPLSEMLNNPIAQQVAFTLCTEMANSFKSEPARRDAFKKSIEPLFKGYTFRYEVLVESKLEAHSSHADLLVLLNERPVLGGENKLESGDAYMQLSRVYQTWINQQRDRDAVELSHGAPMILTCLIGPLLIVAGGFWDGKHVIVEPLARPCLMLPDYDYDRQEQLVAVLLAIREATQAIARLDYNTEVRFPSATPRVYPTFTGLDGKIHKLTFTSRLSMRTQGPDRDLLFIASTPAAAKHVLVKLVSGDRYGFEAHRRIAEAGYAPTLLGVAKVDGARSAYIMEYLSPYEGWKTLDEYLKGTKEIESDIKMHLEPLLGAMQEKHIAHGDLRPNNIMIRQIQGPEKFELKVVDFDWAGESGEVRYPCRRNESIPWPAGPNDLILTEHDRALLMTCLLRREEQA